MLSALVFNPFSAEGYVSPCAEAGFSEKSMQMKFMLSKSNLYFVCYNDIFGLIWCLECCSFEEYIGKMFRFGWSRDLLAAILDYFLKYFFGNNLYISKKKRGMLLFSPDIIATYFRE
jgi:hypothetical protein